MTKIFAMTALAAALTTATVGVAFAQSVPEGQSCGGILCDMGVFGHKVEPQKPPPAVVAPHSETAAVAEPDPEPKKAARKRKHVAKATSSAPVAKPAASAAKAASPRAIASLPMPAGWGAQSSANAEVSRPAQVVPPAETAPTTEVATPPSPARTSARPTRNATVAPSQILDPFSTIPSKAPFRPLY